VSLKLVEVLVLVCAGALFVWWQMRDLRIAREQTRQQRLAEQAAKAAAGARDISDASVTPPSASAQNGAPHAP
jgi:type II secretory pathway component PulM